MSELRLPDVQALPPGTQMPPSEDVNEFNRSMTGASGPTAVRAVSRFSVYWRQVLYEAYGEATQARARRTPVLRISAIVSGRSG